MSAISDIRHRAFLKSEIGENYVDLKVSYPDISEIPISDIKFISFLYVHVHILDHIYVCLFPFLCMFTDFHVHVRVHNHVHVYVV
jgi:hypothetical protein